MRRFLISCAVVAIALVAQVTFVSRLVLPGGAEPDLVLLAVVALALTGGPLAGMLTGFLAGLALDVAPPASHTIGQYALVFCLVGYGCGRLAALGDASPALYVGISAVAAAVGAALHAVLGVLLSDPEVTWAAVRHVLPPSLIYDVILSPFVLYAVVRLSAWAARSSAGDSAAAASASGSWTAGAAALPGLAAGTVRQAGASGTPRLNLANRRGDGALIAAARTASAARPAAVRRPGGQRDLKLHFSSPRGTSTSPARSTAAKSPKVNFSGSRSSSISPARSTGAKSPKLNFRAGRRDGLVGRGSAATPRSAVPRFRRHRVTGTIGTGGALSWATPRRRTFGGGRSPGAGLSSRRAPFGHGLTGRRMFRRGSPGRGSFGGTPSGRGSSGRGSSGRGSFGGRSAPRLRMRRGSVRARISRFLGRGRGGYR
jgi:rod shape-determining protein MreD